MLKTGSVALDAAGISEPRREAGLLLSFAIGRDKTFLIAHNDYELTPTEEAAFKNAVDKRSVREPLQHITGTQEFFRLDFQVNRDVLIPRPETEIIVEKALEILESIENPRFCEVGAGSGCISISILKNLPQATAVALDISAPAIETAKRNAVFHEVDDRLEFYLSDVFSKLPTEQFDLIVSNPPYIPDADIAGLEPEVRDFEPLSALTDGGDGLSIIRRIVVNSPRFLRPGGSLLMEIGFGQSAEVESLFSPEIWKSVEVIRDLQSIPRTFNAKLH
jgi:release factor glutamine methyltransferase